MTYPTQFYDQNKTVGSTAIKHPIYYFQVNLDLQANELVGPNTNQQSINLLHPDQHQTSPDLGRSQRTVRRLQNLTWFPTFHQAGNLEVNDDGTITAYGAAGLYLKQQLTTGPNPLLTVLNNAPFTSATPSTIIGGAYMAGTAKVQVNGKFAF